MDPSTSDTSEAIAIITGSFLDSAGDETLVAMWDTAYSYRYFILAKREDRWRVTGAVRLEGLPMDHRILRVPGKPDILIRRTASAGVPSPTGIDAVRFTRHEVHVSLLADDMRTFDACFPSSFDLKDLAVRDVNSDNIQDVILTVGDFSAAMSSTNAVRSVEEACAQQTNLRPSSRIRHLVYTCDGVEFTANDSAVKLLYLDEVTIESTPLAWASLPRASPSEKD